MIAPMRKAGRRFAVAILLASAGLAVGPPVAAGLQQTRGPAARAATFPGTAWDRIADPMSVGYCQASLDAATARATQLATTAATVVVGGRVLWEYGDQQVITYLASVRKSILAMMYGKPV